MKAICVMVLVAGCTLARVRLADGTELEGFFLGDGLAEVCVSQLLDIGPTEPVCTRIKGGDVGSGVVGIVGAAATAWVAAQSGDMF